MYATHPAMYVRWTLAERTDLPTAVYEQLADDPIPGVYQTAAANPAIGEPLIRGLAASGRSDIRRPLAHNPAIPLDILETLAPITKIGATLLPRIAVATAAEIDMLARSGTPTVRVLVAERRDLPAEVIGLLAADTDAKVLKSLAPNPALTDQQLRVMLDAHGPRVAVRIAQNPRCAPDLLDDLARRSPPVQKVFRMIAAHPNAGEIALLRCLEDPWARPVAARHAGLPIEMIATLLDDPDDWIVQSAASNPALPRTTMESVVRAAMSRGVPER